MLSICRNTSVVLLQYDCHKLIAHDPTSKQLALAFQLDPLINVWKFIDCYLSVGTCKLIPVLLSNSSKQIDKLVSCNVGNIEMEMFYYYMTTERPALVLKRLHISLSKLNIWGMSMLAKILVLLHVKELIVGNVQVIFHYYQANVDESICSKILNLLIFCKLLTELKYVTCVKIDFKLIKSLPIINEIRFTSGDHTLSDVSPLLKHIILSDKEFVLRELFLQTECNINNEDLDLMLSTYHKISVVLLTHRTLVAHNASNHQLLLPLQLMHPAATTWKFLNCQFNADTCMLIVDLLIKATHLHELDFTDCELGYMEAEVLYNSIVDKNCIPEIYSVCLSSCKLHSSISPMLANILLLCHVEKLEINNCDNFFFDSLVESLRHLMFNKCFEKVNLLILGNTAKSLFFYNADWQKISEYLSVFDYITDLYLINCQLSTVTFNSYKMVFPFSKLKNLLHLFLLKNGLLEFAILNILRSINFDERKLEVFICDIISIDGEVLYNMLTEKQFLKKSHNKVSLMIAMKNFVCCLNMTNKQFFQLVANDAVCEPDQCNIISLLHYRTSAKKLFVFQNHQLTVLHIIEDKPPQLRVGVSQLLSFLHSVSSLKVFGIENVHIRNEDADVMTEILSKNTRIEKLFLNYCFTSESFNIILKGLKSISRLKIVGLNGNNITEQTLNRFLPVIVHSTDLKYLGIGHNDLQDAGVMRLAEALKSVSTLEGLGIGLTSCSDKAAEHVAAVIQNNNNLKMLHLGFNNFEAAGAIKVAKALQKFSSLSELHINNNNITEEAVDGIEAVLSCNTKLRLLNVSYNILNCAGAVKVANALKDTHTLECLNLAGINATVGAAPFIAGALSHNNKLQVLNLSSNNLFDHGVTEIIGRLNCTLKVLDISYNNIESAFCLSKALQRQCSSLVELHINNNKLSSLRHFNLEKMNLQVLDVSGNHMNSLSSDLLKPLKHMSSLTKLYFGDNGISLLPTDIPNIIANNKELTVLHLNNNYYFNDTITKMVNAIQHLSVLTVLDLSCGRFTKVSADAIATALSNKPLLRALYLGLNLLATGIIKVSEALQPVSTLIILDLRFNRATEKAADAIAAVLSHNNLRFLDLNSNSLKSAGAKTIAKALQNMFTLTILEIADNDIGKEAADDIAAALSNNTHLKRLNISDNYLQTTGIIKIAKILRTLSSLTYLNMKSNGVGKEAADDIATVLSANHKLQLLNLSDNELQTTGAITISKALCKISSLTQFYIRNNGIGEEAADDIAAALTSFTKLQALDLSCNYIKPNGIIKIANALHSITTLIKYNISLNATMEITDEEEAGIVSALSSIKTHNGFRDSVTHKIF